MNTILLGWNIILLGWATVGWVFAGCAVGTFVLRRWDLRKEQIALQEYFNCLNHEEKRDGENR